VFGAVFLVTLLPYFVTRQIIYGSPFETGYPGIWTWIGLPAFLPFYFPQIMDCELDAQFCPWRYRLFFLAKRDPLLGAGSILTFLPTIILLLVSGLGRGPSLAIVFLFRLLPVFIWGLPRCSALFPGGWEKLRVWGGGAFGTADFAALAMEYRFIFQWGTHMVPARGGISWRGDDS